MSFKRILGVMLASRLAGRGRGRGGLGTAGALALGSRRGGLGRKMGVLGLGYMAYRAYQDHQSRQTGTTDRPGATDRPGKIGADRSGGGLGDLIRDIAGRVTGEEDTVSTHDQMQEGERAASGVSEQSAQLLVQAMVTAAYADGALSSEERERIMRHVEDSDGDAEDRREMERELANPKPLDQLLSRVQGEEMAEEFYLASCAAIDPDTPRNRAYLDDLRTRLGLAKDDADEIEALA